MLTWLRLRASRLSGLLVVSVAAATASQALPNHVREDHDAAWVAVDLGPHQESDHALRSLGSPDAAHPLHCLVCHFARAFRRPAESPAHAAPSLEVGARVQVGVARTPFVLLAAQLTLRSPPPSPHAA